MSRRALVLGFWLGVVGLVTVGLRWLHPALDKAHVALAFLLVVLAGSARDGRLVGLVLSVAGFLSFNFFLIPPFHTFRVADPLDWAVLGAFLVTGGVAAELLHRQQRATLVAERRAREIDRLAGLGAESLTVARAEQAIAAIVRVIRSELPVEDARIILRADLDWTDAVREHCVLASAVTDSELVDLALREERIAVAGSDGAARLASPATNLAAVLPRTSELVELAIPLKAGGRTLGVLLLSNESGVDLERDRVGFVDALAYYAALAVERTRLSADAERVEALRAADGLKDALLASISHDLRTPLTSIWATAQELRVEGEDRASVIEEEAERLNRLVTDLLDLSRLRAGGVPVELELNSAEDLIGAALQRLASVRGAEDVEVRLPPADIPVGRFDFVHALRALTNLMENALRHSPPEAPVEVEVEHDGERLLIRILDRGPGIPEKDRARLFEPFFRPASAAGRQGTGLGLAIARSVAEAQGGAVRYHPRAGGGSVFELSFEAVDLHAIR